MATIEALPVGDPLDPTSYFGPLVNAAARERVVGMIDDAVAGRAGELRTGGSAMDTAGFFVEPTVFADVDNASDLAQQEVFGPVLAITRFRDEEHAVELANDTAYGLSAYLQTRDVRRVNRLVPRLRAGTVFVNQGPEPDHPAGTSVRRDRAERLRARRRQGRPRRVPDDQGRRRRALSAHPLRRRVGTT